MFFPLPRLTTNHYTSVITRLDSVWRILLGIRRRKSNRNNGKEDRGAREKKNGTKLMRSQLIIELLFFYTFTLDDSISILQAVDIILTDSSLLLPLRHHLSLQEVEIERRARRDFTSSPFRSYLYGPSRAVLPSCWVLYAGRIRWRPLMMVLYSFRELTW